MPAPRPRKISANGRGRIRESNELRLLKAAETVFAERGFSGATTAAIAARARLPKANLHYYFRTKAELYAEAKKRDIPGRSRMDKGELERALRG